MPEDAIGIVAQNVKEVAIKDVRQVVMEAARIVASTI